MQGTGISRAFFIGTVVHFAPMVGCDLVCIMASGIVVRMIAPLLDAKDRDPAVVMLDDAGKFAIALLSGHLGGANEPAALLASGNDRQLLKKVKSENVTLAVAERKGDAGGCTSDRHHHG